MRGAGDHLSIGERVAFFRLRRGLTQAVLANLVGRSEDWLSKIERGERDIRRLDLLVELAGALKVTLGDLIGQPIVFDDSENADVPAVRDALMRPQQLSRVLCTAPPRRPISATAFQALVRSMWDTYQSGNVGQTLAALPQLLESAQALENDATRPGWAGSARIHHLAATAMSKIGEADLAWIAAERAMRAADQSDDPHVLASTARAGTHALLSMGRYEDALQLGETTRTWLAATVAPATPATLSLLGMLDLRMAVAAGRRHDRRRAGELLDRAEVAAQRLGADRNYWQTAFGPTNVLVHRVSIALELGDVAFVLEHGPRVNPSSLPAERQVCHQIDIGRAYGAIADDDNAIETFLAAERQAPELVHNHPAVRETIRRIYRRSPASMGTRGSRALALAQRCSAL